MTIQGILKCICHIVSSSGELLQKLSFSSVGGVCPAGRRHLPTLHKAGPHLSSSRTLKKPNGPDEEDHGKSYPSSYTAPQLVYMAKVWEVLLRRRADSHPQSLMNFYLFKIWLFFSKQVLTADRIYKAWLFQQATSDLHRHFVINLYIWKRKSIW